MTYSLAYARKEMLVSVTMHFRVDSSISGASIERQIMFYTGFKFTKSTIKMNGQTFRLSVEELSCIHDICGIAGILILGEAGP